MDKTIRDKILKILDTAPDLTLATIRPDGWPQATTASFVHDGLKLYIGVGPESQKARNIAREPRVSVVVDLPYKTWEEIKGLSMAASAEIVKDPQEMGHIGELMFKRFGGQLKDLPSTDASTFTFVRMTPKVVSVLDYTKGFGHTDLIEVTKADLA